MLNKFKSVEIAKIKGNLSSFIEQAAPKFVVLVCVKFISGIACNWAPIPKEKSFVEQIKLKKNGKKKIWRSRVSIPVPLAC